ncbi:MAG: hypothetical protein US62_C0015G0029 [Candidatus Woesebacteria bacterium GW2011_GWA1_37_8]|uniref:Uncharacterized protein n=2 Tax=Candidatus Woeseibacteriota TaxID=1752722 RepID=A0A0G0NLG3_9BACT|nr:MAG: hypothetical protein US39_C0005G0037 [Microgenomates group bacterium GW2011_GWC1_37_12b]KKQ45448.1 MAG: hypothetical protein US62_C0015G0029 [Candidatus Woesebacteria bacterium GW2011_GWA1_37_8]KKQ86734.1 MAG: hypothetical protein UT10_C0018G0046 [Candidatus Woesebacteria bacterium GW2011_GWB1_38_8b]
MKSDISEIDAKNVIFTSPSGLKLGLDLMVGEIAKFVDEDPSSFYRLVIGSDSQARRDNGDSEVDFVTAVVVHRIGKGARYFYRKVKRIGKVPVLRDKIYTETMMSLNLAQVIVPDIRKRISPAKYDLEIHIDVGSLGPTREMIREVVGLVTGNGFTAKTKPDSWGASSVADKHT